MYFAYPYNDLKHPKSRKRSRCRGLVNLESDSGVEKEYGPLSELSQSAPSPLPGLGQWSGRWRTAPVLAGGFCPWLPSMQCMNASSTETTADKSPYSRREPVDRLGFYILHVSTTSRSSQPFHMVIPLSSAGLGGKSADSPRSAMRLMARRTKSRPGSGPFRMCLGLKAGGSLALHSHHIGSVMPLCGETWLPHTRTLGLRRGVMALASGNCRAPWSHRPQ